MLVDRFKDYLDQADVVKVLNADLKDATKGHELTPELDIIQKQAKEIKGKLDNVTEIALIKEKRDGARERLDLLKEILFTEMSEAGQNEVEFEGKKVKIVSTVKFEKK